MFIFEEKKQREISDELGISQPYVSRLFRRAIKKIRKQAFKEEIIETLPLENEKKAKEVINVPTASHVEKVKEILKEDVYESYKKEGLTNDQIADKFGISISTLSRMRSKWGGDIAPKKKPGPNKKTKPVPTKAAYEKLLKEKKDLELKLNQATKTIEDLATVNQSQYETDSASNNHLIEELTTTKEKVDALYKFVGKLVVENNLMDLG